MRAPTDKEPFNTAKSTQTLSKKYAHGITGHQLQKQSKMYLFGFYYINTEI